MAPRRSDFGNLYSAFTYESFGSKNGPEMFDALDSLIDTYMTDYPESRIKVQRYTEEEQDGKKNIIPFILTIVTPLMKRVHTMVNI